MSKLILRYTLIAIFFIPFGAFAREIALTFDDAPTPDSALMTGRERTTKLIAALKKSQVRDALFMESCLGKIFRDLVLISSLR